MFASVHRGRLWVYDDSDITEVTQSAELRSAKSPASAGVPSVVLKSWSQYHVILYKYSPHQVNFCFQSSL